MLITVYGGERSTTVDAHVIVTWAVSGNNTIGKADVVIYRDSILWDVDIIDEEGRFLMDIHTPHGLFRGIADSPVSDGPSMSITVHHIRVWATKRIVAMNRSFHGMTAGAIVKRAVLDAFSGLASTPITLGSILEAPPIVEPYVFNGQYLIDVLNDMTNQTGQQWIIDDDLQFHWRQRIGEYREFWLFDDGKYTEKFRRLPIADQVAQSIEVEPSGRTFVAHARNASPLWPSQELSNS